MNKDEIFNFGKIVSFRRRKHPVMINALPGLVSKLNLNASH